MGRYFTGKPCKRGHVAERYSPSGACVECAALWEKSNRTRRTAQKREAYAANPEPAREQTRRWKENNPEAVRKLANDWARQNPDRKREHRQRRKDAFNAYKRAWIANRPDLTRAQAARRRAAKLQRTLPGFDEELKRIYSECPEGCEVDHIVPLQGEDVCGLHVPWNMQYLPISDNRSKGNSHAHSPA